MAEEPFDTTEASSHIEEPASQFQKTADQVKSAVSAKADDLRAAATAKVDELRSAAASKAGEFRSVANDKAEELRGKAEEAWGEAKVRARTYQEDGEAYVRENPTRAILGAVAAGFILGAILRK